MRTHNRPEDSKRPPVRPSFLAWAGLAGVVLAALLITVERPSEPFDSRSEQRSVLPATDAPELVDAVIHDRKIENAKRQAAPAPPPPARARPAPRRLALEESESQREWDRVADGARTDGDRGIEPLDRNRLYGQVFAELLGKDQFADGRLQPAAKKNKRNRPESPPGSLSFLDKRSDGSERVYRDASGYWSNSYVPGDPAFRLLEARLATADRSSLQEFSEAPLALHDAARPIGQPFDPPADSALGVYLHADRRGVDAQSRLLLQVGLQATERRGGRRPALNVALVLDLRGEITDEIGAGMRALVTAFGQARDIGDRFTLVVAGRPGGVAVEPRDFRYGYLSVTLDQLLKDSMPTSGPSLGIADAVTMGIETVASNDDPSTPLGSSAVLLVTGQPLGPEATSIVELAHLSGVAGVPLSAVAIGTGVALEQIDQVALAGQGRRRLLQSPAEAEALVDRELAAASRAVARAVRLRIRLAPGVQLIDILGSRRLDEIHAERVREVERNIDRRLAQNLGIEADRGDDEDGIQIVIPSFYAGDSHVILLDVTAAGPGAIADVAVRYKDLVYLRNGVTRASLGLTAEARAAGPLERNVLKNYLSWSTSESLVRAGRAAAAGNSRRAAELLTEARDLLTGLRAELHDLATDLDLARDIRMLDEYAELLTSGATSRSEWLAQLSDSLVYAGRVKLLPPTKLN